MGLYEHCSAMAGRSTIQINAFLFTITTVLVAVYVLLNNDRDPNGARPVTLLS